MGIVYGPRGRCVHGPLGWNSRHHSTGRRGKLHSQLGPTGSQTRDGLKQRTIVFTTIYDSTRNLLPSLRVRSDHTATVPSPKLYTVYFTEESTMSFQDEVKNCSF